MIKTKIVCTLGPGCDDEGILRALITGGMDAARMNFSHGTHEEQAKRLERFRRICVEENQAIPVILDTKGPEIRLGVFPGGEVRVHKGDEYVITTEEVPCDASRACVSYKGLPQDTKVGDTILIDDGHVAMEVIANDGTELRCIVKNEGELSSRKSLNLPGIEVRLPALGERDRDDLQFGIIHGVDYVAASFIRKKSDVEEIRAFLKANGGSNIHIIAKIESREGLDNIEAIVHSADGIMVARGDLGVEIPLEEVPAAQKRMIQLCREWGKPVITATQMLDSMIQSPRPTRAEVTDVANAVYDGTSAVMLSGETASGKYPVEAVETMRRIAKKAEESLKNYGAQRVSNVLSVDDVTESIAHATCSVARDLSAAAIIVVTAKGFSARQIACRRPDCLIIGATFDEETYYRQRLYWGVTPVLCKLAKTGEELFAEAVAAAKESALIKDGDLLVITAGLPLGVSGTTNMLRVVIA
ncbi:MAG: pyruvate kinase [Oscillospiraceae bacterium]|jgi:pyruvate kinase|nr:pyruvate kinase [Oscillospiraceae bacterium]